MKYTHSKMIYWWNYIAIPDLCLKSFFIQYIILYDSRQIIQTVWMWYQLQIDYIKLTTLVLRIFHKIHTCNSDKRIIPLRTFPDHKPLSFSLKQQARYSSIPTHGSFWFIRVAFRIFMDMSNSKREAKKKDCKATMKLNISYVCTLKWT